MNRTLTAAAAALALVGGSALAVAQSTAPAKTGVHDKARMFSAEAVKKADAALHEAESEGKLQVMIETFDELPEGETPKSLALSQANGSGLKGLEVVIAKKEHKVYAEPSKSAQATFSHDELARVNTAISSAFKAGDFDKGLLDAVAEIRRAVLRFGVRDTAKMFTPAALAKADDALDAVRKQTRWGAIVETVDTLEGRAPSEVALERAKTLQVHGLYVLIAKKEHKVYAEPSDSAKKVFTAEKIQAIDQAVATAFKAGDFDKGLLAAVDAVKTNAEAKIDMASFTRAPEPKSEKGSTPVPAPPGPSTPTRDASARTTPPVPAPTEPVPAPAPAATASILPTLLLVGGGVLVFLWLISRLFRRSSPPMNQQAAMGGGGGYAPNPNPGPGGYAPGPGRPGYAPQPPPPGYGYGGQPAPAPGYGYGPPPQQGGGGGFMSGALGGAAGAIAGNILYDHLGRPHEAPQGGGMGMPNHIPSNQNQGGVWNTGHEGGGNAPPPAGAPAETYDPNAGAGAGWDNAPDPAAGGDSPDPGSVGGDWGTPEPAAETGGNWDAGPAETSDWSTGDAENADSGGGGETGGGDWGSGDAGTPDDQSASW